MLAETVCLSLQLAAVLDYCVCFSAMSTETRPCRAVPCRTMSCRAVPCRAVPCRAMLCCAVPCHALPHVFPTIRHCHLVASLCIIGTCLCIDCMYDNMHYTCHIIATCNYIYMYIYIYIHTYTHTSVYIMVRMSCIMSCCLRI